MSFAGGEIVMAWIILLALSIVVLRNTVLTSDIDNRMEDMEHRLEEIKRRRNR